MTETKKQKKARLKRENKIASSPSAEIASSTTPELPKAAETAPVEQIPEAPIVLSGKLEDLKTVPPTEAPAASTADLKALAAKALAAGIEPAELPAAVLVKIEESAESEYIVESPAAVSLFDDLTDEIESSSSRTSTKATIWNQTPRQVLQLLQVVFRLKDDSGVNNKDILHQLFAEQVLVLKNGQKVSTRGKFFAALKDGDGLPGLTSSILKTGHFSKKGGADSTKVQKMRIVDAWFFEYEQSLKNGKIWFYSGTTEIVGNRTNAKRDFQKRLAWVFKNFPHPISEASTFL